MSISSVTSEALQLKLRQLLPSQQGFGTDLSASDTIIPIIDLTASAEGSDVRQDLQKALSFDSQTSVSFAGVGGTIITGTGFWQVDGTCFLGSDAAVTQTATIELDDGAAQKVIANFTAGAQSTEIDRVLQYSYLFFLQTGESVICTNTGNTGIFATSRQIADVNGTLVQPAGFTPQ